MTIMALDGAVRMYRRLEEGVVWTIRIVEVFVFGDLRFTISIINLLNDLLSPRERFESLNGLHPTSVFQIKSRLDPFARIGCVNF